jgi:Spy/CpxP family protein refolding chaperone
MQPVTRSATGSSKTRKLALVVAGALGVALIAGGVALASGPAHEALLKHHLNQRIDAALDAVSATPQQRDAIHAARDHVMTTVQAGHGARQAQLEQALTLWQADSLDATGLAALRAQHQAAAQQTGDAVVQALSDAHDALTTTQRQKLGEYIRANKPSHLHEGGAAPFMTKMVNHRVDSLLDQIKASTDQRDKVHAAVAKALASLSAGNHAADFDAAVALFTADSFDRGQVSALEAKHLVQMQQVGDAMVAALSDIHGVLDAGQRKQVADFIRAHHAGHGG